MKLEVINKKLSEEFTLGIRFMYPPVVLMVDQRTGEVITPASTHISECCAHYTTLCFITDTNSVGILEFNQKVLYGLQGYASRYENISNIEILFSRDKNNKMRLTIGKKENLPDITEQISIYQRMYNLLPDKYVAKRGYIVNDFN